METFGKLRRFAPVSWVLLILATAVCWNSEKDGLVPSKIGKLFTHIISRITITFLWCPIGCLVRAVNQLEPLKNMLQAVLFGLEA